MRFHVMAVLATLALGFGVACSSSSGGTDGGGGKGGAGGIAGAGGTGGAGGHGGTGGGGGAGGGAGGAGGADSGADTGPGDGGNADGGMTCVPACGTGSVCVGTGTIGGAIIEVNDAGVCPAGTHPGSVAGRCDRDLSYACMTIPAGCGGTATCACAASLCQPPHMCGGGGADLTCIEAVP